MTDERLKEIKDSIDLQKHVAKLNNSEATIECINEDIEKVGW